MTDRLPRSTYLLSPERTNNGVPFSRAAWSAEWRGIIPCLRRPSRCDASPSIDPFIIPLFLPRHRRVVVVVGRSSRRRHRHSRTYSSRGRRSSCSPRVHSTAMATIRGTILRCRTSRGADCNTRISTYFVRRRRGGIVIPAMPRIPTPRWTTSKGPWRTPFRA